MPSASGSARTASPGAASDQGGRQDPGGDDPVLVAERDYLRSSREFLRLMRENVLSLRAMGGDRVSEEYLKADLYRRAEALVDLPDTPLFFGRLDYAAAGGLPAGPGGPGAEVPKRRPDAIGSRGDAGEFRAEAVAGERFHIGRRHVHDPDGRPVVIDWRAPVSRPFYRASPAEPMGLALRRRFGFSGGREVHVLVGGQLAAGQPDPDRRDRAATIGPDARHRGDHPARPG